MQNFKYKDSDVNIHEWVYRKVSGKKHTCFCCNHEIENGANVVLLINNYKYIPNLLLHATCAREQENNTDSLCDDICKALSQYKQLDNIFGDGYC